jgi:hypothetical protein
VTTSTYDRPVRILEDLNGRIGNQRYPKSANLCIHCQGSLDPLDTSAAEATKRVCIEPRHYRMRARQKMPVLVLDETP